MAKIDWSKAKTHRGSETKYEDGKRLDNGVVVHKQLDGLALRARAVERAWLAKNRMNTIYDSPPKHGRKKQKYKGMMIFNQPAKFSDVVLDILNEEGIEK